jgi:branched-chain amino acid transport system permease protein
MMFFDLVMTGLTLGAIYGLIALSLSLVYAGLDMVHFAQGEFAMLGAFVGLMLFTHLAIPFYMVLIVGAILTALIGVLIERIVYRPLSLKGGGMSVAGFSLVAAGVGMSVLLQNLAWLIWTPFPRSFDVDFGSAIQIGSVSYSRLYFYILASAVGFMVAFDLFLARTKWGCAIRAVAHNRELAYLMGIDVRLVLSGIFGLAAGVSGFAGILIAPINFVEWHMGLALILKGFAAAVIGGLGSLRGAILGGFFLGVVESVTAGLVTSTYKEVVAFFLLIVVLYVRPEGFFRTRTMEKA